HLSGAATRAWKRDRLGPAGNTLDGNRRWRAAERASDPVIRRAHSRHAIVCRPFGTVVVVAATLRRLSLGDTACISMVCRDRREVRRQVLHRGAWPRHARQGSQRTGSARRTSGVLPSVVLGDVLAWGGLGRVSCPGRLESAARTRRAISTGVADSILACL